MNLSLFTPSSQRLLEMIRSAEARFDRDAAQARAAACPQCRGTGMYDRLVADQYGPKAFHRTVCHCRSSRV